LKARCMICTKVSDWFDDLSDSEQCPICGNLGHLRPHIVWVGEEPLGLDKVYIALATCELFVAIGNAGGGEPGRSFLAEAPRGAAHTIESAGAPTPLSGDFGECRHGQLDEIVPEWMTATIARG